jgi:hypothetical protein
MVVRGSKIKMFFWDNKDFICERQDKDDFEIVNDIEVQRVLFNKSDLSQKK